jgi:hypothetical protein
MFNREMQSMLVLKEEDALQQSVCLQHKDPFALARLTRHAECRLGRARHLDLGQMLQEHSARIVRLMQRLEQPFCVSFVAIPVRAVLLVLANLEALLPLLELALAVCIDAILAKAAHAIDDVRTEHVALLDGEASRRWPILPRSAL